MLLENMPVIYVIPTTLGLGFLASLMGERVAKYVRMSIVARHSIKDMLQEKDVFEIEHELQDRLDLIEREEEQLLEKSEDKND